MIFTFIFFISFSLSIKEAGKISKPIPNDNGSHTLIDNINNDQHINSNARDWSMPTPDSDGKIHFNNEKRKKKVKV